MNLIRRLFRKIKNMFSQKEIIPIYQPVDTNKILQNKVILITGGTGGIGFAIAKQAVASGAKVILCGTNVAKLNKLSLELGENAKSYNFDLSSLDDVENILREITSIFPENRIDILVNSAGIHGELNFLNESVEEFDKVMNINVKATYFISQVVAKQMIEKGIKGHILNVSSSSALRPASTPYQISKWAVNGITKGLADVLLPYGIIVNAIAPGPTATSMVKDVNNKNLYFEHQPSHRYATPEEIANLAIFMLSDMGNMIVGDTYYISGGSGTISYHR